MVDTNGVLGGKPASPSSKRKSMGLGSPRSSLGGNKLGSPRSSLGGGKLGSPRASVGSGRIGSPRTSVGGVGSPKKKITRAQPPLSPKLMDVRSLRSGRGLVQEALAPSRLSSPPPPGGEGSQLHGVSHVWVTDAQEAWALAKVLSVNDAAHGYTVELPGGRKSFEVKSEDTRPWDPSHGLYLNNAAQLNNLHEAALLNLLRVRFEADDIYTYTGDVLISVNPYKEIPLLYNMPTISLMGNQNTVHTKYNTTALTKRRGSGREDEMVTNSAAARRGSLANKKDSESVLDYPHVYAVADRAYRYVTIHGGNSGFRNQSIIITGESGAGKTEAAKYVMRYLIAASRVAAVQMAPGPTENKTETAAGELVEGCLLQSTTVLEAFGNAKTVRNDNSSRFGKYIKLQYGASMRLVGARTLHFLLEKSRLVFQDPLERNYHVFYQLCKGMASGSASLAEEGELTDLLDASAFNMLNQGGIYTQSDDVDDAAEFSKLCAALNTLGVDSSKRKELWRLLLSLLQLGNIKFIARNEKDIENSERDHKVELELEPLSLNELANQLGLPVITFVDTVRTRRTQTGRGSWFDIPLDAVQAKDNLDALIKHLYGQVFSWLVGKVNDSHEVGHLGHLQLGEVTAFIGILDIFGFEIMTRNSFEQLCINFANEVLQQQFNQRVFVLEQEAYAEEGLDWAAISFKDNQPVIDLIMKKPTGLLIQLEELGLLGRRADNKALLQLYHNTHLGSNENYSKPRFEGPEFNIHHFAGQVTYNVSTFLQKNNDSLEDSLLDILDKTTNDFLYEINNFSDKEPFYDPNNAAGTFNSSTLPPDSVKHMRVNSNSPRAMLGGNHMRSTHFSGSFDFGGSFDISAQAMLPPVPGATSHALSNASQRIIGAREENKRARQDASGVNKVHQLATTVTVSRAFRSQLHGLMQTLRATEPHYIKCIKPNTVKMPGGFSPHLVRQQLNYSGVLEVVRIRREGYPVRLDFKSFYSQFELLAISIARGHAKQTGQAATPHQPADKVTEAHAIETANDILTSVLGKGHQYYQVGKTMVFLKEEAVELLRRSMRHEHHAFAIVIQSLARRYLVKCKQLREKKAATAIQNLTRMRQKRRSFIKTIDRVVIVQRLVRGLRVRKQFQDQRANAVKVQTMWRRAIARNEKQRRLDAIANLQRVARGMLGRKRVRHIQQCNRDAAATKIQNMWRQLLIYREARRRRRAGIALAKKLRGLVRNRRLRKDTAAVFKAAQEGHVNTVAAIIKKVPEMTVIRNRYDNFKTLVQAASCGGNVSVVSLLDPLPADVTAVDSTGSTALHYAAASCKYDLVKFLASKARSKHMENAPGDVASMSSTERTATELRATKRISLKIISDARAQLANSPGRQLRRQGSVLAPTALASPTPSSLGSSMGTFASTRATLAHVVHSGWLDKRRSTGKWQRRWCVATETRFEYYHHQKDYLMGRPPANSIALASSMLRKTESPHLPGELLDKRTGFFEIHSSDLLRVKRNKEGRLYFKAKSDEEAYQWLVPLRVLCKEHNLAPAQGGAARFVDTAARQALVRIVNKAGETPLHFAAKYPADSSGATEAQSIARVQIASWLTESGADVNAMSSTGETAVYLSMKNRHVALGGALCRKGANLGLKTAKGVSAMELVQAEDAEQMMMVYYKVADQNPLLTPPLKMNQLTYLSFYIEKLAMTSTAHISSPVMTISVYGSTGKRTEKAQDVTAPVVTRPAYLWWASNWHMQNPMENIGKGCVVIFELKNQNVKTGQLTLIAWAACQLDKDTVRSHEVSLEMYLPPMDLCMRNLQLADMFLSGDIVLTTATQNDNLSDADDDV